MHQRDMTRERAAAASPELQQSLGRLRGWQLQQLIAWCSFMMLRASRVRSCLPSQERLVFRSMLVCHLLSQGGPKNYIIRGLDWSPDNTKLAVAQSDSIIYIYKFGGL